MQKDDPAPSDVLELGKASEETASKAGPIPEFTLGFEPSQISDD